MRNWSVFTGRFAGVDFRVHVTFLFLLIFILLPEIGRGTGAIIRCAVLTLLVLISVVVHEVAHSIVSARQGFPVKGILLLPIGGIVIGDPGAQEECARSVRREALIAVAGPLANAFLAAGIGATLLIQGPASRLWQMPIIGQEHLGISLFWINVFL